MNGNNKTKIIIGTPKSETSQRTIPLTQQAAILCRRMQPQSKAAYALTGTLNYMEPRTLQYRLERYTKDCGLEGIHFHTLRHTFATRCVEVGFELKSLSEILGHASTTITLDRYVHYSMDLKRDNMGKLAAVGL
jgi:integrase